MMKAKYLNISWALLTIGFVGCGNPYKNTSDGTFIANEKLSTEQMVSVEERAIATRICYAYQSMAVEAINPKYKNVRFRFDVKEKTCSDETKGGLVTDAVIDTTVYPFRFLSQSGIEFRSTIQSATDGIVDVICQNIFNHTSLSNTLTLSSNKKAQVKFLVDNGDSYVLKYFTKGLVNTNDYVLAATETIRVLTSSSTSPVGLETYYRKQTSCEGSTNIYDFVQKNY